MSDGQAQITASASVLYQKVTFTLPIPDEIAKDREKAMAAGKYAAHVSVEVAKAMAEMLPEEAKNSPDKGSSGGGGGGFKGLSWGDLNDQQKALVNEMKELAGKLAEKQGQSTFADDDEARKRVFTEVLWPIIKKHGSREYQGKITPPARIYTLVHTEKDGRYPRADETIASMKRALGGAAESKPGDEGLPW